MYNDNVSGLICIVCHWKLLNVCATGTISGKLHTIVYVRVCFCVSYRYKSVHLLAICPVPSHSSVYRRQWT